MWHWIKRVLPLAVLGLLVGPVIGTFLGERWPGVTDGFVGSLYGLYIGPLVGALIGVVLALAQRPTADR